MITMSDSEIPEQQQSIIESDIDLSYKNDILYREMTMSIYELLSNAQKIEAINLNDQYDPSEDYKWFTSGQLDTSSFKGQYIAIWKKQVIGTGSTAEEVERLAKGLFSEDCKPAIIYIPKDEEAIL